MRSRLDERPSSLVEPASTYLAIPVASASEIPGKRCVMIGFFPAYDVERFDEFADAVSLGAEQAELDDLFVVKMLGEICIDFVFVDGVLALLEQVGVMQRRLLACGEVLAAGIIEQIADHDLG